VMGVNAATFYDTLRPPGLTKFYKYHRYFHQTLMYLMYTLHAQSFANS
jgi:hypothetical protein